MQLIIQYTIVFLSFLFIFSSGSYAASTGDFSGYRVGSDNLVDCNPNQCENVGSVCYNGPSTSDSGGCGIACGQGGAWTQYQVKCKNWEPDPDRPASCQETLVFMDRVCSTADKCSGNQPYLQAGSCSCGTGNTYKTCCTNTSPSLVSGNSCVQISVDTTNPPYEGVCPGGSHAVQCGYGGYPACGQAACGDPSTIAPAPSTAPGCGASCIYSEGGACKSGNCLDGSNNCGFNSNCGFVSACSTGSTVTCPGPTPSPGGPPPPSASCSIPTPSCSAGTCTFNLNYQVGGTVQNNFQAKLYPDINSGIYKDFTNNPTTWIYSSGTYTARVNVTGGDGAAVCESSPFTVTTDNSPPTCTSMTLFNSNTGQTITSSTPLQRGTQVLVDFNLNDSGSNVALAELFVDPAPVNPQSEAAFYNSLNQNPFQKSFGYNTTSLTTGTHTFVVNAIDNNGNAMTNNATCTKQLTITNPNWLPPQCNAPGNFSGCTLQGGTTCSDAGPGDPQYPNWSTNLQNLCLSECAKYNADPSTTCTTPSGTLTVPATVGRNGPNAWANMTINFNTTNTQGGEVYIHTSTCSQASCNPNVGWTRLTPVCETTTNGSKACTYTPPSSIQPNTSRTFALFGKNPRIILDTKDTRFGQVCTPGETQIISCSTTPCVF